MFQTGFPSIINSSKLHIQQQVAVRPLLLPAALCAVLSCWWWTEKPSETYRASYRNELWKVASCWLYSADSIWSRNYICRSGLFVNWAERHVFNGQTAGFLLIEVKNKVKQPLYKSGQAHRFPGGWGSSDFKAISTEMWYGCQTCVPIALSTHEIVLVLIFIRDWVEPKTIVWPEGLSQWKFPVTPPVIENATFLLLVTNWTTACHTDIVTGYCQSFGKTRNWIGRWGQVK